MNTIKKCITQWDKIVDQYDKNAKEFQKQIAQVLKSDWTPENPSAISVDQMKEIIARTGKFELKYNPLKIYRTILN